MPLPDFVEFIHQNLLGQLYDFGQTNWKFQAVLMPLVAQLRKAEKEGKL